MKYKNASFVKDTAGHSMTVRHDSGSDCRHLTFSRNGRGVYRFDLITWPGHLCISGDMGTYVFRRIVDMFEFFRGGISTSYAAEKVLAEDINGRVRVYSEEVLRDRVKRHFDEYWDEIPDYEADRIECWYEIDSLLSTCENEHEAYSAVHDFEYNYAAHGTLATFTFQDFFDAGPCDEYTPHFLWCLDAIVWGIAKYDEVKNCYVSGAV